MKKLATTILLGIVVALSLGCQEKFSVIKLAPSTGAIAGGETVEIMGTGFDPETGVTVYFGNSKAPSVVVASPENMTVTTPSILEPNTVDVRIATDDGKEFLLKGAFRYIKAANIDIGNLGQRRSQRKKASQ